METIARNILTQYWGHLHFRPLQEDIIRSVHGGQDTLALLPTGGGKSICFQVPGMVLEGVCIVISPLIALMKDQVENLKSKGIHAAAIYSGMTHDEADIILDNCVHGKIKFLYLSPERLLSELIRERILKMKVNLIAVDEAHCISQWGYDFRPPYLRIAEIRDIHPAVPVLALTATATPVVRKDIMKHLGFRKEVCFVKSFERKNLSYICYHLEDKDAKLLEILKKVRGTGIVYVRNRKKTQTVARFLQQAKISADYYHAGLATVLRNKKQDEWKSGKIRIMVCTNAFGMGIDKPDVRTVIHLDLPDSLEAYYQEAGRAGRDEKPAYAVILFNQADINEVRNRQQVNFPQLKDIRIVYQALANYLQVPVDVGSGVSYDFDITKFTSSYDFNPLTVLNCLRVLETEEFISVTDSVYMPSRIHVRISNIALYEFQVKTPRYDHFIKTILRTTEGVFDDYVKISEPDLARKAGMKYDEVVRALEYLKKTGIINYEPRKDSPQLVFTAPREHAEHLSLDEKSYLKRKELYIEKSEAVIRYAQSEHNCRSMMLLDYFGEKAVQRCGICDYCRERNKLGLNEMEFINLQNKISEILTERNMLPDELIEKSGFSNKNDALEALRWMVDNTMLSYTESGMLRLNRKIKNET